MVLPSVGRLMCVGYWQLHVPAPVTSDRSVAFDGLAEPEPELDELVERVGATGVADSVDPVAERLWVSLVAPMLADVCSAGV